MGRDEDEVQFQPIAEAAKDLLFRQWLDTIVSARVAVGESPRKLHEAWLAAWPEIRKHEGDLFRREVLGVPFRPEDFQQKPSPEEFRVRTGRMSSSDWTPKPHNFPYRRTKEDLKMNYVDSKGTEYTPETAYLFRDVHLINALRKFQREGSRPIPREWMMAEASRRGLLNIVEGAIESLHAQAADRGLGVSDLLFRMWKAAPAVRKEYPPPEFLMSHGYWGHGVWADPVTAKRYPPAELGDMQLTSLINHESSGPRLDPLLFREWNVRTAVRDMPRLSVRAHRLVGPHPVKPPESQMEDEEQGVEEVPLSDLVKVKKANERLFAKIKKSAEMPGESKQILRLSFHRQHEFGWPLVLDQTQDPEDLEKTLQSRVPYGQLQEMAEALGVEHKTLETLSRSLARELTRVGRTRNFRIVVSDSSSKAESHEPTNMYESQELKTMTESTESRNMSLEEELAAHKARVAELEDAINKKKGLMGHPTAVMLKGGMVQGTKLLVATEAMDMVKALARKVALKFFIPEGHENILDTPQGEVFIDLSMPIALHLAASQGLFGQGSEFVAATGEYAFIGNWFKHGKVVTGKMKEVAAEFSAELAQLKEMGKELLGFGQSDNLLSEVTDFTAKAGELAREKEKVKS